MNSEFKRNSENSEINLSISNKLMRAGRGSMSTYLFKIKEAEIFCNAANSEIKLKS